jgi:hypothetical protein
LGSLAILPKLPINFFSNPSHSMHPTATNPPHVPLKINNKILFIFSKENVKQNIKILKLIGPPQLSHRGGGSHP